MILSIGSSRLYFSALVTDYDGTIAHGGLVGADTCDALKRFKATSRRLY